MNSEDEFGHGTALSAEEVAETNATGTILNQPETQETREQPVDLHTFDLSQAVVEAATCVSPYHPLSSFIHCNALAGFEQMPFDQAMNLSKGLFAAEAYLSLPEYRALYAQGRITPADLHEAVERLQSSPTGLPTEQESLERSLADVLDEVHGTAIVSNINRHSIKWCSAYFDETQAQWSMDDSQSFFDTWRRLVRYDVSISLHGAKHWKRDLLALPADPSDALLSLLHSLGVGNEYIVGYLRRHLTQMPGWASHLKWRQEHGGEKTLLAYLALRLFYEWQFAKPVVKRLYKVECKPWKELRNLTAPLKFAAPAAVDTVQAPVWQEAYELNYRNRLLRTLSSKSGGASQRVHDPLCQLVFCIDVRSEPVRRALDLAGKYETYGSAGFFGFPFKFNELGSDYELELCPVLIKPEKHVHEVSDDKAAKRLTSIQAIFAAALHLQKRLKSNLAGAFGLVETFGPWSVFPLLGRTFFPRTFHAACEHTQTRLAGGTPNTHLDTSVFTLQERIALAASKLRLLGLTKGFAPVVVLCGHKSQSSNNPFAASLDCGACGGNPGGTSARFAASVLNEKEVRTGLQQQMGIEIPDETVFVPGEHNTTIDAFEFFLHGVELSDAQKQNLSVLLADLNRIGKEVQAKRMVDLPLSSINGLNEPWQRAHDWAQVTQEWGLSRNASFIAAPRGLTHGLDLDGRAFLQSYECNDDPDGSVLEQVMTAPMVVAQWINAEFYLSTVDNDVFGSGSKVVHNVVGDFGVMSGASSDLRIGLPWQSVKSGEDTMHHEPMRLVAVLRAPTEAIDRVLAKQVQLGDLVRNRWIRLIALDPATGKFLQADAPGQWRLIADTDPEGAHDKGI